MSNIKNKETRKLIRKMHKEGWSNRAIGRELGVPESTIRYYVNGKTWSGEGLLQYEPEDVAFKKKPKARILVLDIETKYMLLEGWQMFNQNFSVDQIAEDWSILSYSAKWLDSDEVIYSDVTEKTEDDILQELHDLLEEAHFVIAHNGKRFDLKKIRARMITRGFKPYSPVRIIDTLEICKGEFAFTSNKLLYVTRLLCKKNQKSGHAKFSGHLLWKEFLKGNPEAIQEMRDYNVLDVVSLQELYEIIAPWSSKLPNFDIYEDDVDMSVWEEHGFVYTNLAKYRQYRNKETGQFRRGRTNLLSKEERSSLLANI